MTDDTTSDNESIEKRLGKIKGISIRRRVSPDSSSSRLEYTIIRTNVTTWRGKRIHFQLFLGEKPLFHTKLKTKRPSDPIPIASGSEIHLRSSEFAGYLHCANDHHDFCLRSKEIYGPELLSVHMIPTNGKTNIPKTMKVSFFIRDSLIPSELVNRSPVYDPDGSWELDFHNRYLIPSIKNVILIDKDADIEYIAVRKTNRDEVRVDAVGVISPISVFAIALSLFISPI